MSLFKLKSPYELINGQKNTVDKITESIKAGNQKQAILGVTGSGKTFTMANIIANLDRPALVMAHNKTLAAQLAQEFKEFFPDNEVHYFVSYYDYYQPEAYVVKTDTYIEKEATINEEIDRLRHAATENLLTRRDVIIVASVSCIYGIGEVDDYTNQILELEVGKIYEFESILDNLVALQFKRAGADFKPGTFHILGDTIEIYPSSRETVWTLEFFGNELDRITRRQPLTGEIFENRQKIKVFPAKHTVTTTDKINQIVPLIKKELEERLKIFTDAGELVKAERLKTKVEYDIEMMLETGYVNGIENYSMYLSDRKPGESPSTLLSFFPKDFLTFIDESHMTIPQIGGMYAGDRARKENLIQNGFRLPSAFENRPLKFDEFEKLTGQTVYVSATPADYEVNNSSIVVEQIIRPTGLLDPNIEVKDMNFMVDDIMSNIVEARSRNERVLITTITKKSSEQLSEYLASNGVKVRYLHSEVETLERLEIIRDLRSGKIEVIVGVNLLREGLDLPEVSFIGIIDADKQGFLRSTRSLLQIIGRAARNVNGRVTMYSHGARLSKAMEEVIEITKNRRELQDNYNKEHNIEPFTVLSKIKELAMTGKKSYALEKGENLSSKIKRLELEMDIASVNLEFEKAAEIRDILLELRKGKK
ncbi:MAG: excinuclease ABC subunit UvrB [Candidatus Gracilibacteria bacterium]|nr:excinuclease ABC subunit UvrB [Candidatus Gracilibacteria bacterium]MDD2908477.1 excinuclease ABC subunit UvrB [Candidatus Gracilibacteria bacterium]